MSVPMNLKKFFMFSSLYELINIYLLPDVIIFFSSS